MGDISKAAVSAGFTCAGIASADVPLGYEAFDAWLKAGFDGPLAYMRRQAELRQGIERLLPGAKSVLAVGLNYYQHSEPSQGHPKIARYALGRDYHRVLRGMLRQVMVEAQAWWPDDRFRICVDSAPVLERAYAHQAGLGWFGKNTCLIDSRRGSWFVIGLLATTRELEPSQPSVGGCGTCSRCVDACPTGAIRQVEGRWMVDAGSCISTLTIEQKGSFTPRQAQQVGDWTFGCDVCQEVCPFNQPRDSQPDRAPTTTVPDFLAVRNWPDLESLSQISEDRWDALTQGSPVRRAGWDGLRRNAKANLGNRNRD